jgi:ankyrin repeat protein
MSSPYKSLLDAAKDGEPIHVYMLLEFKASVNATDGFGWSAIHYAAREGGCGIQLMLDHNADINCAKRDKWTTLHIAAYNQVEGLIKQLIDRGARSDLPNV